MQDGGLGRYFDIGHVGVPDRLSVSQISNWLAVLDDIGDDVEFRMLLVERLAVWVWSRRIELAEVLAERDEFRIGELLSTEHHNKPIAPRIFDRRHLGPCQRLGKIDAAHLRAQHGVQVFDRYGHRCSSSLLFGWLCARSNLLVIRSERRSP